MFNIQTAAGRLLWIGFRGHSISDEPLLAQLAAEGIIGGILLLNRNIIDKEQLTGLCQEIHALPGPHRLRVCIDQEGGRVSRLPWLNIPTAQHVAQEQTPAQAEALYGLMAQELHNCGVDWNLGPVVDVNIDPDSPAIGAWERSYSSKAHVVTAYASAFVRAHRALGVRTCLKHYPGHGSAGTDTHKGLADISQSWNETELTPYADMISSNLVDAVMLGHLLNKAIDDTWPATLSSTHIGRLRNQIGWQGIVVSDDMQMGALSGLGKTEELMLRALQLGVDVFLAGNWLLNDLNLPHRWAALIKTAVQQHQQIADRIVEANERLAKLFD